MFFVPGGNAKSEKADGGEAKAPPKGTGQKSDFEKKKDAKKKNEAAKKSKVNDAKTKAKAKDKKAKKKAKAPNALTDPKTRGKDKAPPDADFGVVEDEKDPVVPKPKKPKTSWVEFTVKDPDGTPLAGLEYVATDSTGERRTGEVPPDGVVRLENTPEGMVKVAFPALAAQFPAYALELKVPALKKKPAKTEPKAAPKAAPRPPEPPKKKEPEPPKKWVGIKVPRDGHTLKNDDDNETKWFPTLAKTTWDKLQAGDVLIRKTFAPHVMRELQRDYFVLYGPHEGSPMTIECGIVLDDGTLARMSATSKKAIADKPASGDWIAYRPMDAATAKGAVETATWLLGQPVSWSILHLLEAAELGGITGAKKDDPAKIKAKALPRKAMHEGEWLMHCFQANVAKGLDIPASVYSPGRVEQRLNDSNYKLFSFVGAMSLGADDAEHEKAWRKEVQVSGRPAKGVEYMYKNPTGMIVGGNNFAQAWLRIWPPKKYIPVGTTIRPPKKSSVEADTAAEQKWFGELEKVEAAALQPGDIVLRKVYKNHKIKAAQKLLMADKGTQNTVHAMLYVGNGKVIECSHKENAVTEMDLPPVNWIAYRPQAAGAAQAAVETARWMTTLGITYSVADCLATAFRNMSYGPLSKARAAKVRDRKKPVESTMCSGLVGLCFQGRKTADIELDVIRASPMHLEDWLNEHPALFKFAGSRAADDESDPYLDIIEATFG